jgi:hypothetical protein
MGQNGRVIWKTSFTLNLLFWVLGKRVPADWVVPVRSFKEEVYFLQPMGSLPLNPVTRISQGFLGGRRGLQKGLVTVK